MMAPSQSYPPLSVSGHGQEEEIQAAQPRLVWQPRERKLDAQQLDASQLDEEPGLSRRPVRRTPGHRHLQYLVGAHALQWPLPRAGRVRQARRVRSGWI